MRPVFLSSSYFVRDPFGISTNTSTLRRALPGIAPPLPCAAAEDSEALGRASDDHRDLALRRLLSEARGQLGRGAADELFVQLRDLTSDDDAAPGRDRREVRQEVRKAVRALVEHDRAALGEQPFEHAPARPALLLDEAHEGELPGRQAGGDERRDGRGGSGDRHDLMAGVDRGTNELLARIGERGRSRVRDERDVPATVQLPDELDRLPAVVEVGVRREVLRLDPVAPQQDLRVSGVLARDHVHLLQDPERAMRDVLEVPDGRRDEIELPHHTSSFAGRCVCAMRMPASTAPPPAIWASSSDWPSAAQAMTAAMNGSLVATIDTRAAGMSRSAMKPRANGMTAAITTTPATRSQMSGSVVVHGSVHTGCPTDHASSAKPKP